MGVFPFDCVVSNDWFVLNVALFRRLSLIHLRVVINQLHNGIKIAQLYYNEGADN